MSHLETKRISHDRGKLPAIACLSAMFLAGLGLIGWLFGQPLLASFRPSYIPMAPSTSLCFLIIGLMWLFPPRKTSGAPRVILSITSIVLVTVFCIMDILKWSGHTSFDIESIVLPQPDLFDGVPLARVAPLSAGLFVLTGLATLLGLFESISPRT